MKKIIPTIGKFFDYAVTSFSLTGRALGCLFLMLGLLMRNNADLFTGLAFLVISYVTDEVHSKLKGGEQHDRASQGAQESAPREADAQGSSQETLA